MLTITFGVISVLLFIALILKSRPVQTAAPVVSLVGTGAELSKARKDLGLTVAEAAERSGVSTATIYRLEASTVSFSHAKTRRSAAKLLSAYGASPALVAPIAPAPEAVVVSIDSTDELKDLVEERLLECVQYALKNDESLVAALTPQEMTRISVRVKRCFLSKVSKLAA